jgi:hypothetical protein
MGGIEMSGVAALGLTLIGAFVFSSMAAARRYFGVDSAEISRRGGDET